VVTHKSFFINLLVLSLVILSYMLRHILMLYAAYICSSAIILSKCVGQCVVCMGGGRGQATLEQRWLRATKVFVMR